MDIYIAVAIAFSGSFLAAILIVTTGRLHGGLTFDNQAGVQKLHSTPVPRIGGVAILVGALAGGLALHGEPRMLWWLTCLAAIPAFGIGLLEDLTKSAGVRIRLLTTIAAGAIFVLLTDYRISAVDIPGVDLLFSFWLLSFLFTSFAAGGAANALNIIDGVNGLASGTAIILLLGSAVICWQVGDMPLFAVCMIAAAAIIGFFLVNFPLGLIFLGDAGAYAAGFVLACVTVMLPARNPELSPIIGLLILSYPVIETLVSIWRRLSRSGANPGQPDRLHLHSLIYRSRARRAAQALGMPGLRNPVTSIMVWPLPLLSMALAICFQSSSAMVWVSLAVVLVVYLLIYRRVALLPILPERLPGTNNGIARS